MLQFADAKWSGGSPSPAASACASPSLSTLGDFTGRTGGQCVAVVSEPPAYNGVRRLACGQYGPGSRVVRSDPRSHATANTRGRLARVTRHYPVNAHTQRHSSVALTRCLVNYANGTSCAKATAAVQYHAALASPRREQPFCGDFMNMILNAHLRASTRPLAPLPSPGVGVGHFSSTCTVAMDNRLLFAAVGSAVAALLAVRSSKVRASIERTELRFGRT